MATKNSINNASAALAIDPGASGDSYVQFDINATNEWILGQDDTDSDKLKLSQGGAIGTNDSFTLTLAGSRNLPLQPAFLAKLNSTLNNVTGDGTNYGPIVYETEIFDQNGDYDHTTGYFTAPLSGVYYIGTGLSVTSMSAAYTRGVNYFITSNGQFYCDDLFMGNARASTNAFRSARDVVADMDAADTVYVGVLIAGGGKILDLVGAANTNRENYFYAYLVC